MLSDEELIHYSRQVILSEIDEDGQNRLKQAKVTIVGLGGLGSSCALYLAAAGVGKLTLIDHDKVESSNLQRQIIHSQDSINLSKVESAKKRLLSINPNIEVLSVNKKVTDQNIRKVITDHDVLVDASDNYSTRYLLNRHSIQCKTPLVHASAIKFQGHITTFNLTDESPCYECLFENSQHNNEDCESQGVFSPIVGVIGSMQASEALKVILKLQCLDGQYLTIDLLNNKQNSFRLRKNKACKC